MGINAFFMTGVVCGVILISGFGVFCLEYWYDSGRTRIMKF